MKINTRSVCELELRTIYEIPEKAIKTLVGISMKLWGHRRWIQSHLYKRLDGGWLHIHTKTHTLVVLSIFPDCEY